MDALTPARSERSVNVLLIFIGDACELDLKLQFLHIAHGFDGVDVSDADLAYYYMLQTEARKRTVNAINKRLLKSGGIARWDRLTLCSVLSDEVGDALAFAMERWRTYYGDATHWGFTESWERLAQRYLLAPDAFNLAIWQEIEGEQVLVALALGNPSHARTHLTIKWVERYFGPNHLGGRALWPILGCAEEYAKLLGSKRVLIKDAVDPGKYERYGYSRYRHPNVAHGGDYLGKEVTDD